MQELVAWAVFEKALSEHFVKTTQASSRPLSSDDLGTIRRMLEALGSPKDGVHIGYALP